MANSCWLSRGGDAGSLAPSCSATRIRCKLVRSRTDSHVLKKASEPQQHNNNTTTTHNKTQYTTHNNPEEHTHKDDQTTLRAIMSAGLWDKHLLHKAGLAMDSRCDRCVNDRDDTYQRFWECTALKATFEEDASLFQEFRYGEAPACLTSCGLATELAGNVKGASWTSDGMREQDQLQRKRKYDEWVQIHREMQVEGRTARQVLAEYHGPDRILDVQLLSQNKVKVDHHSRSIHLQSFCRRFRGPPTLGLASPTLTETRPRTRCTASR